VASIGSETGDASTVGEINKAGRRLAALRVATLAGETNIQLLTASEIESVLDDIGLVEELRERHAGPLRNANANLRHYVRPYFERNSEVVSVTQRLKKFSTILDKLDRYPKMRLTSMEDLGGVRAVLPEQVAADEVVRRLRKNWKVHRYRDYVRKPKSSGYRALHLIVVKQGVKIEVQLRTYLQDYWANQVERDSRHLRVDYKSGKGKDEVHAYYVAMSELLTMREASTAPSHEFSDEIRRRYTAAQPYLAALQPEFPRAEGDHHER
jgi:ppGpp synthetase/RelA/SpoT-type nucleotidyltranferase